MNPIIIRGFRLRLLKNENFSKENAGVKFAIDESCWIRS